MLTNPILHLLKTVGPSLWLHNFADYWFAALILTCVLCNLSSALTGSTVDTSSLTTASTSLTTAASSGRRRQRLVRSNF